MGIFRAWILPGVEVFLELSSSYNVYIHLLFIYYFVRDTCISVADVSNRSRFDTFFTLIFSFENGVSNE